MTIQTREEVVVPKFEILLCLGDWFTVSNHGSIAICQAKGMIIRGGTYARDPGLGCP